VIGVPALHWKLRGTVTVVSVVLVGLYSPNPRVALLIVQALATVAVTVTVLVGSAAWAVSGLPTKNARNNADEVSTSFAGPVHHGAFSFFGWGFSVRNQKLTVATTVSEVHAGRDVLRGRNLCVDGIGARRPCLGGGWRVEIRAPALAPDDRVGGILVEPVVQVVRSPVQHPSLGSGEIRAEAQSDSGRRALGASDGHRARGAVVRSRRVRNNRVVVRKADSERGDGAVCWRR